MRFLDADGFVVDVDVAGLILQPIQEKTFTDRTFTYLPEAEHIVRVEAEITSSRVEE
jgi:hypothetical protein